MTSPGLSPGARPLLDYDYFMGLCFALNCAVGGEVIHHFCMIPGQNRPLTNDGWMVDGWQETSAILLDQWFLKCGPQTPQCPWDAFRSEMRSKPFWNCPSHCVDICTDGWKKNVRFSCWYLVCCVLCLVTQPCPTLCDPVDCSPPGSSCPWGFSRQEYWSELPCHPSGDLPNPGIKPRSPALQVDSLLCEPPGKPLVWIKFIASTINHNLHCPTC